MDEFFDNMKYEHRALVTGIYIGHNQCTILPFLFVVLYVLLIALM